MSVDFLDYVGHLKKEELVSDIGFPWPSQICGLSFSKNARIKIGILKIFLIN